MGALARALKSTGKRILARLPSEVREALLREFLARKLRRLLSLQTPVVLTYFVTNACNLRCAHCFYWRELGRPGDELPLNVLSQVAHSLRHPVYLSLTGGEPALRSDLVDICRTFHEANGCRHIAIATNGLLPKRVTDICQRVLDQLDLESLDVQISLDGPAVVHDTIRGIRGAHARAMQTLDSLRDLANHEKRLRVHAALCIQQANINCLEGFIDEMQAKRINHRFTLLRGNSYGTYRLPKEAQSGIDPRVSTNGDLSLDQLRKAMGRASAREAQGDAALWPLDNRVTNELALRVMATRQRQLPCYAGSLEAVLYPSGEVAMCELSRPVGHLGDFRWDMAELWKSAPAEAMRGLLQECCCIHGCNLSTSMQFDAAVLSRLQTESLVESRHEPSR